MTESPVTIPLAGDTMIGVLHEPSPSQVDMRQVGVLIVVGGPQYRVGSHRQFVLLARLLAEHGFAVLRFDYRGMGDSSGEIRSFEECGPDLEGALDFLVSRLTDVEYVAVWGLCDGASASLMHLSHDSRVVGQILLNPWVRTETGLARTYFRSYYVDRIKNLGAWRGVLRPRRAVRAVKDLTANLLHVIPGVGDVVEGRKKSDASERKHYTERMLEGMRAFRGHVLVLQSEKDITGEEFAGYVERSRDWKKLIQSDHVDWRVLPNADHTCSTLKSRDQMFAETLQWLEALCEES